MQLALHGVNLLTSVAGEVGSFASMRPDRQGDFGSQTLPDGRHNGPLAPGRRYVFVLANVGLPAVAGTVYFEVWTP